MTNPSGLAPVEFNVVVQIDPVEEKTVGGIIIPQSKKDVDELAMDEGTLVAISPVAFTYENWPEGSRKPQVGDRVLFARYGGGRIHERGGYKYRVMKDRELIAIIEPPALAAVA